MISNNLAKFKKELAYCIDKVRFYRIKLESIKNELHSIECQNDILSLPYTNKNVYRENFPLGIVAAPYKLTDSRLFWAASSGTSGDRLQTVELGGVYLQRAINALNGTPIYDAFFSKTRKVCRYAPPNCSDVECSSPTASYESRIMPDGTLVLTTNHNVFTNSIEMVEKNYNEIMRYTPNLLHVDPMYFVFLISALKTLGKKIPDIPVLVSYSFFTRLSQTLMRSAIESAPIINVLAMSEVGFLGGICENGNMHLNDRAFFLEIITRDGAHAQKGELGELVVSTLDQGACPFVRYRTGDVVTHSENQDCNCGCEGAIIKYEGRIKQFIALKSGCFISPDQVDQCVGVIEGMLFYQFQQLDYGRYIFKYVEDACGVSEDNIKNLESRLHTLLVDVDQLAIERSSYIDCSRGGKFIFCVSDVSEYLEQSGDGVV